jgi:hypothetical protein
VIVYNRRSFHYYIEQFLVSGIWQGGLRSEGSMSALLSRNVEVSSIGARPLVNVYTPGEMRRHLEAAGFTDVGTSVSHFHPGDTFITAGLAARLPVFRRRRILDALGRLGGWYVIATGSRK